MLSLRGGVASDVEDGSAAARSAGFDHGFWVNMVSGPHAQQVQLTVSRGMSGCGASQLLMGNSVATKWGRLFQDFAHLTGWLSAQPICRFQTDATDQ
jgi:hypothetical protein